MLRIIAILISSFGKASSINRKAVKPLIFQQIKHTSKKDSEVDNLLRNSKGFHCLHSIGGPTNNPIFFWKDVNETEGRKFIIHPSYPVCLYYSHELLGSYSLPIPACIYYSYFAVL